MGLFTRRKKFDDLDLPPPPPPTSELPPVPMPEFGNEIELPPLPSIDEKQSSINFSDLDKDLPPLPSLDSDEKEEEPKMELPDLNENYQEKIAPRFVEEEKELPNLQELRQKRIAEGPLFVNVTSYKDVISNVNIIKDKIKESEAYLERLNEIKNMKDKYFEQLRVKLEDLQRKSLYVDKNLFE
jgi:hypothetical protein